MMMMMVVMVMIKKYSTRSTVHLRSDRERYVFRSTRSTT